MPKNKPHFKDEWLSDPHFKKWAKRYPGDSKKAICVLCNKKTIDIANVDISRSCFTQSKT